MLYSICVATYKRLGLLEKLLYSLSKQNLPKSAELEIIVVDNDKGLSARKVVSMCENTEQTTYYYYSQPKKNISLTRNIAVEHAAGEFLLFIDDDEIADIQWINNLIRCLKNYDADGVFGRVVSYFDDETPEWTRKSFFYNRPTPPTGTIAAHTRTTNCIIKVSVIKKIKGPFDLKYGITGGEDTHLFGMLIRQGAKFINCYEALTLEYVPPYRTTISWQLQRAFRLGNNFARRSIEMAGKRKIFVILSQLIKSTVFIILSIFLTLINLFSKANRFHWILKISANMGKIAAVFDYQHKEYK